MTYIVLENTPGYLPEDDDPFITNSYADAVGYANDLADRYEDDDDAEYPYVADRSWASSGNYYAISITQPGRDHDLGRYIGVETLEDDMTDSEILEMSFHLRGR